MSLRLFSLSCPSGILGESPGWRQAARSPILKARWGSRRGESVFGTDALLAGSSALVSLGGPAWAVYARAACLHPGDSPRYDGAGWRLSLLKKEHQVRVRGLLTVAGCIAAMAALGNEPETVVSEAIDVLVVGVDVVVTDKRGVAVRGLGREDFEVMVDGEPTEIVNFFAVEAPRPAAGDGVADEEETASPLQLALYVDNSSIDPSRRNIVLDEARAFLRRDFSALDRMMLVAADRSSFEPLHAFTDRLDILEQGLDELTAMVAHDRRSAELREILGEIERFVLAGSGYSQVSIESRIRNVESRIRAYSAETHRDTLRAASNLRRLVDTLAGMPGKKAILYLGGSLSLRPAAALNGALTQALGQFPTSTGEEPDFATPTGSLDDGGKVVEQVAEYASMRGVTLYAVAAGDLTRATSLGLSRRAVEVGAGMAPGRHEAWAPGTTFSQRMDLRSSLELLAETTGGLAKVDGQGLGSLLERISEDRRTFYSLGLAPPEERGGDLHRLEIKVAGRGRQVRYRRAHRPRSEDQRVADRTLSTLLTGDVEQAFEIHLAAGETRLVEGDLYAVPLSVQVPIAALALTADGAAHTGQVSIFIVTGDGLLAGGPVRKAVFPVTLPNAEILDAMGRMIDYRMELHMPRGPGRIAVSVRDDLDPRLATAALEVKVGEAVGSGR